MMLLSLRHAAFSLLFRHAAADIEAPVFPSPSRLMPFLAYFLYVLLTL